MNPNELIYDRTQEDINYALLNPSSIENLKGTYNYIDLNRIEKWLTYLKYKLSSHYDTNEIITKVCEKKYDEMNYSYENYVLTNYAELLYKGNWNMKDIPYLQEIERIVKNIEILRNYFKYNLQTITNINFDKKVDFIQANTIEKIIYEINKISLKIKENNLFCGQLICGNDLL